MNDEPPIPLNYRPVDPRRRWGWPYWIALVVSLVILISFLGRLLAPQRPPPALTQGSKRIVPLYPVAQPTTLPESQPTTLPASTQQSDAAGVQTWTGIAVSTKSGMCLSGARVYVDLPGDRWPDIAEGRRVVVTGRAVVRHDLPVFIVPKDGYPPGAGPPAGIPVPQGTDLYKASERTVIEDAKWHLADKQN